MKVLPAVFLVLYVIILGSCSQPAPKSVTTKTPLPGGKPLIGKPSPAVPPANARVFDESLLTGKEFLLQKQPVSPFQGVSDFDLGQLETEANTAKDVAVRFFDGLKEKGFDASAVNPRWAGLLKARFLQLKDRGWAWNSVRWGQAMHPEEGGLLYAFVVREGNKKARGLVYLSQDPWRIDDFQVDDLSEGVEFDPGASSPSLLP